MSLDYYSMIVVSQYFETGFDFVNLIKTCKEYSGIIDTYKYNPITVIKPQLGCQYFRLRKIPDYKLAVKLFSDVETLHIDYSLQISMIVDIAITYCHVVYWPPISFSSIYKYILTQLATIFKIKVDDNAYDRIINIDPIQKLLGISQESIKKIYDIISQDDSNKIDFDDCFQQIFKSKDTDKLSILINKLKLLTYCTVLFDSYIEFMSLSLKKTIPEDKYEVSRSATPPKSALKSDLWAKPKSQALNSDMTNVETTKIDNFESIMDESLSKHDLVNKLKEADKHRLNHLMNEFVLKHKNVNYNKMINTLNKYKIIFNNILTVLDRITFKNVSFDQSDIDIIKNNEVNLTGVAFRNMNIVELYDETFLGHPNLRVILPESLVYIGKKCFDGIAQNVELPPMLKEIGGSGFACSKITEIDLKNVEKIGGSCFYYCTQLTSVKLSRNLTEIPDRCFDGCSSLKEIVIPKNIKIIGNYAFSSTYDLKSVTFESVKDVQVHSHTFYNSGVIKDVQKHDNVTHSIALNMKMFSIDKIRKYLNLIYLDPNDDVEIEDDVEIVEEPKVDDGDVNHENDEDSTCNIC